MTTLALDVDGVLLDPEREGSGHWTGDLERRYGITREQLRRTFFTRTWDDVINGRRPIAAALAESLAEIGTDVDVEDVLACWFEADFVVIDASVALARQATAAGCAVVLATNQEHRRAAFLRERLPLELDDVLYSADLSVQKHHAEFFELASTRLGVPDERRSDIVFVDDVEHNVLQARAAGWRAIHAAPGADWIPAAGRALGL